MAEFVEKAIFTLECTAGAFRMEGVTELSVDAPVGLTPVKTMNRLNRVRGHRGGPAEISGTLTIPIEVTEEAPMHQVWRDREVCFARFAEGPGTGARFNLPGFMIDNLARSYNAEGEAQLEVSWVAQDLVKVA